MNITSLNEVLSAGGQKHLLAGDAFLEHYGLGCDLGWIYDKLISLDKVYFHDLAAKRSEMALERTIEQTTPLALATVRNKVVRQVALRRLTRECYPAVASFINRFDTCHTPTLMPMVEIMSARVLELNLKREHDRELTELLDTDRVHLDEVYKIYRNNCPAAIGAKISEHRDLEAFKMLSLSADLRHYGGTQSRRAGDVRAFGSKLVYSLKRYDWRSGNYKRPKGQWQWKCQPLEDIGGDVYILAEDYQSLESDDRAFELIHENRAINAMHVVMHDQKVVTFSDLTSLNDNKRRLRDIINKPKFVGEEEIVGTDMVIDEASLAMGGAK